MRPILAHLAAALAALSPLPAAVHAAAGPRPQFATAAAATAAGVELCGTATPAPVDAPDDVISLDLCADGADLHVLYAEEDPTRSGSAAIFATRSADRGISWTPPLRVDTRGPAPLARGRGTDYQIAAHDGRLVAVWLTHGTGFGGRGPLACAYSMDGGASWSPGATPADDGGDGDHAFVDLAATPDGAFHAVWLDTRSGEGKGLYAARSDDGGRTWQANRSADSRTCECCWNTLRAAPDGRLFCIYRDIDPRDMGVVTSFDGGDTWAPLPHAGDFGWQFKGCPHAGAGLAVEPTRAGPRLHAAVWTGKDGVRGLHYLHTLDESYHWSPPRRFGSEAARHPDVAVDASGRVVLAWTEPRGDATALMLASSRDGGATWADPEPVPTRGTEPSHPRLLVHDGAFHLVWTHHDGRRETWTHRTTSVR